MNRFFTLILFYLSILAEPSALAAEIILLRHGESDHNVAKIYNSHVKTTPRSALTPLGRSQVQESVARLKAIGYGASKISQVYFSPLLRTRQTAEILAEAIALPRNKLIEEPLLIEPDMGRLEGKKVADTLAFFPNGDDWDKSNARQYGGETNEDLARRIKKLLQRLRKMKSAQAIVLVTHGSTSTAILTEIHGPQTRDQRLKNAEFRTIPLPPN